MLRLLIILSCLTGLLTAQTPRNFIHFTEKDGLSDNQVNCIFRDRQGWLWVGTPYGLNRFDGHEFRRYLPDARHPGHSVSNEYINDIDQDSAGFLWIATYKGLNRYDPKSATFKVWENTGRNDGSLPNSLVAGVLAYRGLIWLNCDNRDLTCLNPLTGKFTSFPWKAFAEKQIPKTAAKDYKTIWNIRLKSSDELWLSTNLGLFSFHLKTQQFTWYSSYPASKIDAGKQLGCSQKEYYGSYENDLQCLEKCTGTWRRIPLPLPENLKGGERLSDINTMGSKRLIIGQQGLMLFDTATEKIMRILPAPENNYSAPTGNIRTFLEEPDGTIWLGGDKGLWQWDPRLQHFQYTEVVSRDKTSIENAIYRILDARSDGYRYMLHVYQGLLLVFEQDTLIKTIRVAPLAALLYEDRSGQIWVGSGKQLYLLDRKKWQLTPFSIPQQLFDPAVGYYLSDMTEDSAGNYWIATNGQGLIIYNPKKKEWTKPGTEQNMISKDISCLFADTIRRTVWMGCNDFGLYRYDERKSQFKLYRHEEKNPEGSLAAYVVRGIAKDKSGYIWASTDGGGISRFDYNAPDERAFTAFTIENGLPSNRVVDLITDLRGNIWGGTVKGLFYIDHKTLQIKSYDRKNGMYDDLIDMHLAIGNKGEIMVGSKYGYQTFFPDSLLRDIGPKGILITSFKIFERELLDSTALNYRDGIELSWRDNFFSFRFAATDFAFSAKKSYAYRLAGFHEQWITCGPQREAIFTNVPPGDYVLEVRSGINGTWNPPGIRLAILIRPPFWKTGWFYILITILFSGILYGIFQFRTRQIRREEAMKSAFNQRLAQIEMTALRAQMNPHFVFNCLNSINRFILVNDAEAASAYLTKFSRLIRLILDNSREDLISLDRELEALRLYIELEAMRFHNRFDYEISIAPELNPAAVSIPPMMIQPYIENAIWHGLMHRKENGHLQLSLTLQENTLVIVIEDNGIGRAKAAELKSKSAAEHKSHGMQVTSERIELVRKLYGITGSVETTDLMSEQGEAIGTRVVLRMYAGD